MVSEEDLGQQRRRNGRDRGTEEDREGRRARTRRLNSSLPMCGLLRLRVLVIGRSIFSCRLGESRSLDLVVHVEGMCWALEWCRRLLALSVAHLLSTSPIARIPSSLACDMLDILSRLLTDPPFSYLYLLLWHSPFIRCAGRHLDNAPLHLISSTRTPISSYRRSID